MRLGDAYRRSLEVARAPRVAIDLYGDRRAESIYRTFRARHRRFRFTSAKRWGVALLRLPDSVTDYLGGGRKALLRQKRRLAHSNGLVYSIVQASAYFDDILAINRSAPNRQGRAMPASYLDADLVHRIVEEEPLIHGILDRSGRLRAYAIIHEIGDVIVFGRLLGHSSDLDLGTMYLLVSEVIAHFIEERATSGVPNWAMYDTFWGAAPGLAYFKRRLGFQPHTVTWRWVERS